ncbi:AhpD-like protein [Xylariales sp. PMI_506]|nr:AhpD-like protein [Xylariales sp. PMI_506]
MLLSLEGRADAARIAPPSSPAFREKDSAGRLRCSVASALIYTPRAATSIARAIPATSTTATTITVAPSASLRRLLSTTAAANMRIPYTSDPLDTTDAESLAIAERVRQRRAPRPLQPLDLALLHAPPVADGWNSFLGAVRTRTTLDAGVRELAISRVAVCNRAWYEWAHHAPLAVAAGVPKAAMDLVKQADLSTISAEDRAAAGLGDREWVVLRVADEMTRNVEVKDETFAELKAIFNDREVVEVVSTVACYNCVSRFLVALDVGERNGTGPNDDLHH